MPPYKSDIFLFVGGGDVGLEDSVGKIFIIFL